MEIKVPSKERVTLCHDRNQKKTQERTREVLFRKTYNVPFLPF